MLKKISKLLGATFLTLLAGEIFILIIGYRAFHPKQILLSYQPTEISIPDSLLGYTSRVGAFTTNKNNQLFSAATHWSDHSRATRTQEQINTREPKPKLHLYGCSLTYGQHLEDPMTLAWKLQSLLPQYDVRNYAFIGYGLHQSYLQLKHHISQQHIPDIVIVNYASFHNERNVLTRNRQKQLVPYIRQKTILDSINWPVLSIENERELKLDYEKLSYQEWPGMRWSALIHFFEHVYNQLNRDLVAEEAISYLILKQIQAWSEVYNFQLLVTGIFADQKTKHMLNRCQQAGIQVLDISVDLENPDFNLMPFDGHPNASAHTIFAERILAWLKDNK